MKRLWRGTLILLAVLSAVQGCLLTVSKASDPPFLTLFAQQGCDSPCWHHIQLGKTTLTQAEVILRQDMTIRDLGFSEDGLCWTAGNWQGCLGSDSGQQTVNSMTFYPPDGDFRLGDAVQVFGEPLASADACLFQDDGPFETTALILFAHQVQLTVSAPTATFSLSPSMRVNMISYSRVPSPAQFSSPWRGFTLLNDSAGNCE